MAVADASTLVWWDERDGRFALVRAAEWQDLLDGYATLRSASTFGELREQPPTSSVHGIVVTEAENYLDMMGIDGTAQAPQEAVDAWVGAGFDEGDAQLLAHVPDDTPWDDSLINDHDERWRLVPWAAEWMEDWLDPDLLDEHGDVSGASPGGHLDVFKPRDIDAFLEALVALGFRPEHRPTLIEEALNDI